MSNTEIMWVNRSGRSWGLAHVLRWDYTWDFLGTMHAKTMCGREVRADRVVAAGYEDRCQRCCSAATARVVGR